VMPPQVRLYTWLDVEDTLLQALEARSGGEQSWFVDATAYWDRLVVRVRPGNESQAERWLRELFDPRTTPPERELEIVLESSDGQERRLPVAIEAAEGPDVRGRATPSFARPSFIRREREPLEPPELPPGSPPIFAMHSFKGGVGRTIHALALARVIAEERGRALLVDADLEAPGITWLLETRLAAPPIAFADVLALVHGDPDPAAEASIQLVADRLYGASLDNLFVLPAFRSSGAFHSLEIRPEHLLLGRKDPFVLSNTLTKLGSALGVDAIVVDLRAGLSEIAAGLLLDPRVYRVLVTTMSGQSVNGTELVLDLLARRARSLRQDHPVPVVLLNQVPVDFRGTDVLAQVEERLLAAVSRTVDKEEEIVASDVLRGPTWFDASLLMLPGNWDEALGLTRRDAIQNTIRPLADFVPSRKAALAERPAPDREEQRKALAQTATRLIFAEAGGVEEFLPISPLRRLVADHRAQVPIAVVVGAKGAGKTYTYLQVVRRRTWRHFAEAAGETETSVAPLLCPVLQPKNLGGAAQEILTSCRQGTARELALGEPLNAGQIEDKVRGWLKEDLHEGEWRERWLDLMAWTTAFRVNEPGAGRHLAEYLATRRQVLLFPFDGIEDLFQDLLSSEPQQRALRALLQDVPNWLEQQPGRRVGALVFVRRDMVAIAVRQNVAQLLARYDSYTLKWDSTEALRLVAWVANQSELLPPPNIDLRQQTQEELITYLIPLWGRKLGSDKSREGRSAEWVIAALSDFRGQIQARDVVRFLSEAAQRSIGNTQWPDRILAPSAIRDAIADCSKEKIDEISTENPALGRIFNKLRAASPNQKSIPFKREDVGVDADELQLLELNGIVVADEGCYYMPEIFRRGLDFRLPLGARPKVLALARRRRNGT
jgi:MinD-like ATPase involved in chromosome partitioning or flagellar assembly